MRNILFIGGPIDGEWLAVDERMPDFRVMKEAELAMITRFNEGPPPVSPYGPHDEVKYTRISLTHHEHGHIEVMFINEGVPLLQKLIDGYKAS